MFPCFNLKAETILPDQGILPCLERNAGGRVSHDGTTTKRMANVGQGENRSMFALVLSLL